MEAIDPDRQRGVSDGFLVEAGEHHRGRCEAAPQQEDEESEEDGSRWKGSDERGTEEVGGARSKSDGWGVRRRREEMGGELR